MPQDFINCQNSKGKIRTVSGPNKRFDLKSGEYIAVCFDSKGMHRGEVHKKEKVVK